MRKAEVCTKGRSLPASLAFIGQVTKHTTVSLLLSPEIKICRKRDTGKAKKGKNCVDELLN